MPNTDNTSLKALPAVGRLLLAAIFIISALGKLAAPGITQGYIASAGLPFPVLSYAGAVLVELGGGLMLLLGLRTRFAAIVLAIFSIVAAAIFHHALGDQNQFVHFMKNLAIAGGLLQVAAFGAGSFSLDNRAGSTRTRRVAA